MGLVVCVECVWSAPDDTRMGEKAELTNTCPVCRAAVENQDNVELRRELAEDWRKEKAELAKMTLAERLERKLLRKYGTKVR